MASNHTHIKILSRDSVHSLLPQSQISIRAFATDEEAGLGGEQGAGITMHRRSDVFSMQTGTHRAYVLTDGGPKVTLLESCASSFVWITC